MRKGDRGDAGRWEVKVTVQTLTDEMIRVVLADASADDDDDMIDACRVAMGERPATTP